MLSEYTRGILQDLQQDDIDSDEVSSHAPKLK